MPDTDLSLELWRDRPLYGPKARTGLPGVVILHGSEGPTAAWSHRFAAILAAHSMLALPHACGTGDYWGAGPIGDVPLPDALAAVADLAAHPRCRDVGVFGWSMVGQMALVLAACHGSAEGLHFVAAHAAPVLVHGAFDPMRFREGGKVRRPNADALRAWAWAGHEEALVPGVKIDVAAYPGPMFLSVGLADEIRDPDDTRTLAAARRTAGLPVEVFLAEDQGHALDFGIEPEFWRRRCDFIGRAV